MEHGWHCVLTRRTARLLIRVKPSFLVSLGASLGRLATGCSEWTKALHAHFIRGCMALWIGGGVVLCRPSFVGVTFTKNWWNKARYRHTQAHIYTYTYTYIQVLYTQVSTVRVNGDGRLAYIQAALPMLDKKSALFYLPGADTDAIIFYNTQHSALSVVVNCVSQAELTPHKVIQMRDGRAAECVRQLR